MPIPPLGPVWANGPDARIRSKRGVSVAPAEDSVNGIVSRSVTPLGRDPETVRAEGKQNMAN
ncbi:hypothetical protein GCM10009736_23110 [Actinomadura bangladeshensis]